MNMFRMFSATLVASILWPSIACAQTAIVGDVVYTMNGPPIENGVVLIEGDKITAVGPAGEVEIPRGYEVLTAKVVTPGLIDSHSVVGLGGFLNQDQDQDQLEMSSPIQPALRAIDAYNSKDELVEWIRGFGVTTIHTGHAPGQLMSGQTMIVKTAGNSVEDAVLVPTRAIAATLNTSAANSGSSSPGTRGKMLEMLRGKFIEATEYKAKIDAVDDDNKPPARDLNLDAIVQVLDGEVPLMITADRAQDIASALRLADEFGIRIWLDSAAEAYLMVDEIKAADVPVLIHPSMARPAGDRENQSFMTAANLMGNGIPVAMQSGFEGYVPKTRVVLYEAAITAANGLTFEQALATITINAAIILGVDDRVGSIEPGKDADIALYDGDPFEYTSHCVGVLIDGRVVSNQPR